MFLLKENSLCTGHKRNIKINENSYKLYRYQHVEVDMSLFVSLREYAVSDAECSIITPSFHFYIHFMLIVNWLRLRRSPALILRKVCSVQTMVQTHACVISIGSHSWFKTRIFPTLRPNQLPLPPYRKRTKSWHHFVVSNRTVNFLNCYTP